MPLTQKRYSQRKRGGLPRDTHTMHTSTHTPPSAPGRLHRPVEVTAAATSPPSPATTPMAPSPPRSPAAANRPATLLLLLVVVAAATPTTAAAAEAPQQLALSRPDGDCLAPAITSLTASYNFYPKAYQLQSIAAPSVASSGLSTTVEFASDFSVTYYGTYKVVTNSRAGETYLLYQCGTPNPAAGGDTEARLPLPPGTKVFQIPLVSVAVTDSNAAAFLSELGVIDRVAFASEYSYNACLQAIHACGGNAVAASNDSSAEWEVLAAGQQPQVDALFTGSKAANAKSVAVTAFADPGVLNRAEWVKFVAVFFNKEVEANSLVTTIAADYQALNASARAASAGAPTRVAWVSKSGESLTLSYAVYKQQYVTDAGGVMPPVADVTAAGGVASGSGPTVNYVFNASRPAQAAGFFGLLETVDVIFDESYAPASSNLPDLAAFTATYGPAASALPAVTSGRVFAFNNRLSKSGAGAVGSDWFETSVARPDLVLQDFVQVLTPSAAPEGAATLTWLRRLPSGVTASAGALTFTTAASCAAIARPGGDAAARCTRPAPVRICPNAFRDCVTGELKTATDPTQRCSARTVCPAPTPVVATPAPAAGTTSGAGAARVSGLLTRAAAVLAALALAALLL